MSGRALVTLLLWTATAGLAHLQVWVWLRSGWPTLRERGASIRAALVVASLAPGLTRIATHLTHSALAAGLYAVAMTEAMVVVLAALPLFAVRMVAAVVGRRGRPQRQGPEATAPSDVSSSEALGRRAFVERVGGSLVLGATGGTLGHGALVGRHDYRVEEVVIRLPGLPRALEGYTIAQVSDLHAGPFSQERELARGLGRIRELSADLIVVTGDLVDFDPAYIPTLARALGGLRARDGVAAILGNHDYYAGADAVADAVRAAGVTLLRNDGRLLRAGDSGGFALLGVDDAWSRRYGAAGPRLDRALAMVPPDRPRVLLSHQPSTVDAWAGQVGLQLSGHTHGGQVNPIVRPADYLMPYVAGRFDVAGTTLYVNRGFGVVGPPARVGAPPEITKIVLVGG